MTERNQPATFSYYVICADYGRNGREAIVNPEMTRRGAAEKVREILGDGNEIAYAHFITMNEVPDDVKDALIDEAMGGLRTFDRPDAIDAQAARFDHARDLRKHEVA